MTRLILNADDFGLTPGVNRSIIELHRAGALTSATLMATAEHISVAIAEADANPGLGVGCHVVLVDGISALPANQLPRLAPSGAFRPTLASFVRDLFRGTISEAEIEAEAVAQMRRLQEAGVRLTHLDTHKHTHMFLRVLRPVLRAAVRCGVRAVRNPFEPDWALKATPGASALRRIQVRLLRSFRKSFLKEVERAGMATTDGALGILATGTLDSQTLDSLLAAMPSGIWELVCHPGYFDNDLKNARTRLRESRTIEHQALSRVIPEFLHGRPDVSSINFAQI